MDRNRTRLVGLAMLMLCGHIAILHASTARQDFATSACALIDSLQHVYASMNYERYCALFTNPAVHGIDSRFFPYEEGCTAQQEWGYVEEMRIHRRMFRPETIGAGEEPLPAELWVKSIHVRLQLLRDFGERWDLYRSEQNPTGELDRQRWRAMDAVYATSVVWRLRKGGQFAIAGQARFVVIEDLSKTGDDPGRFLVHHWEDLGPGGEKLAKAGSH